MNSLRKILILTLASFEFLFTSPVPSWEKTRENQTILTFQKTSDTGILQVKGVTIMDTRIDITGGIFRDIPNHYKWVGYCEQTKLVKIIDEKHYVFYEILAPPWPVSKRDLEMKSEATYYYQEMKVNIDSVAVKEPETPESKEYVRIKEAEAKIRFEYISENKTGISYELKINPAGEIPTFIINIFNQEYIYQNMQNLKNIAMNNEYIKTLSDTNDTKLFKNLIENPATLKSTLENRLARYTTSPENLQVLANDADIFRNWKENKNGFADLLFLGHHDFFYQKKALENIMLIYFEKYRLSESEKNKLKNDPEIKNIFTRGNIKTGLSRISHGNHRSL